MSAQLPPSVPELIVVKLGHPHHKPDLVTEPEWNINSTSMEGVVRRLLEPSVDRAEEREYQRCTISTLVNGVNSDVVIQLDMLTPSLC